MTDRSRSALTLHVGRRVKHLRVASGMSQTELGEILGLTFQQVQKYEKGQNAVSIEKLWVLAQHYQVDVAYFLKGFDGPAPTDMTGSPETSVPAENLDNSRLRLEIGRGLLEIKSQRLLREILCLIRSVLEPEEAQAAE